jgi:photosystem II stability/assembly factor-like uncharacterized protein
MRLTKQFFSKFVITLLFFQLFSSAEAQNNFAITGYGTSSYYPREIFFGDTSETYFVGQCNVRGSINNEVSWNGYCYTPLYIMGGCSPSLANTFVVGKNGLIRKNGACEIFGSWYNQTSNTSDTLYSIKFYDNLTGVTVGQNGRILRTTNNGDLWTQVTSGTSASLRTLIIKPDSSLVVCGAAGTVLTSPDKGITWNAQTTGSTTLLNDIDFPTNDTGYAVGRNGVLLKTVDAGMNWFVVASGTSANLNAVDFVDGNTGLIAGAAGLILRTTDGGATWTNRTFSTAYEVFDIKFKNKLIAYVATTFDAYKSTDGGITWYNMGGDLQAVTYINDTTLIAVGDNIVRKSFDGGLTWNSTHPVSPGNWYDCVFPTADTGYICGSGGKIIKTIDGGQSYTQQVSNAPTSGGNYYFGMHFFDKNKGIAVGSQYMISRTSNGGQTWTTNYSSSTSGYGFYDVFFINDQVGWMCGSQGAIRKSVDGGATWTSQPAGIQKFLLSIYFLNPLKGFAVGEGGTLLKTINGGTTWTNHSYNNSSNFYSIAFRDSLNGYISGDNQILYTTVNGGTTWKYTNNSFTMRKMVFRNPFIGYAVGADDARLIFDPIKTLNGYARFCKGSSTSYVPRLVSGITIQPGNSFVMEMDTTGDDFTDPLFLGATTDTTTNAYWYINIPESLKAGIYKTRVRATATTPVNQSIYTNMTLYDDAIAELTVRNDTLFALYNAKYIYQWRKDFTLVPGANAPYFVPTGPGKYTVEVFYGCCNYASDFLIIDSCSAGILVQPVLKDNYAVICDSSSATLTAGGTNNLRWYDSDSSTVVLGTGPTFITPILTLRDTFYVASFNDSCESTRLPINVQFTSKPTAPLAFGDSVCSGEAAYLICTVSSQPHWFSDSLTTVPLNIGTSLQVLNVTSIDTFYVSQFNYKCESARTPVVAYPIDAPVAGTIAGDTAVSIGDTVSYNYFVSSGNTVNWFVIGATILSSLDSLVVKWDSSSIGRVGLVERNASGCKTDTVWLNVEIDLALKVVQVEQTAINIVPNPANSSFSISRPANIKAERYELFNSKGKLVLMIQIPAGKSSVEVDVSKLASGVYTIRSNASQQALNKLVIQH